MTLQSEVGDAPADCQQDYHDDAANVGASFFAHTPRAINSSAASCNDLITRIRQALGGA